MTRRYNTLVGKIISEHTSSEAAREYVEKLIRLPLMSASAESGCAENDDGYFDIRKKLIPDNEGPYHVLKRNKPMPGLPLEMQIKNYIDQIMEFSKGKPIWITENISEIIRITKDKFGTTRGLQNILLREIFHGSSAEFLRSSHSWNTSMEITIV